jgi:hypothetical protein
VAEVTQNSVLLGWVPLTGATGYILRWKDERGETKTLHNGVTFGSLLTMFHNERLIANRCLCVIVCVCTCTYLSVWVPVCVWSLTRYWSGSIHHAAWVIQLLQGDRATSGPEIPLHTAAQLPEGGGP